MEVKSGYKQTEAGVIPEDWAIKTLGNIASIATGNTPPTRDPANYGDEFLFVSPMDMGSHKHIFRTERRLSQKGFEISRPFPTGSVLFVCIGSTIGKCGIATETLTSNQQINAILPSEGTSSDYLYYAVSAVAPKIQSLAGEQAVPIVNKTAFSETVIPLPPTKIEQEAIADALSDADGLIEELDKLTAKKRRIKQGAMQELLTGKKRLPGFRDEWEVKRLGEILSRLANGAVYKATNSIGVQITRIETIADGTIDYSRTGRAEVSAELKSYKLVSGDILFSHINSLDHIGKVAQFLGNQVLYHGMNLLLIRVNKYADSRFLYFWFTSNQARQKARNLARKAINQASINTTELKALEILLPPLLEQTAIATILSDMDEEIAALEAKLYKARQIKQGMMQELLTGRIRLI